MITLDGVKAALRDEDIEGLIELGAPNDEYDDEAKQIEKCISSLEPNQRNPETITAIIALVWAKFFNRSEDEIRMRLPAFQKIAQKLF